MDDNLFKCFTCEHRLTIKSCFNPQKCQRKTNGIGIIPKIKTNENTVIHTQILIKKNKPVKVIPVKGRKVKKNTNLPDLSSISDDFESSDWKTREVFSPSDPVEAFYNNLTY